MEQGQQKNKKNIQYVIEPSESESLMKQYNVSTIADLLPILAGAAALLARPPISNFPVGAAALGSTGRIYLGCNVEFLGLPLHQAIHAEQFLLTNAALHGEPRIISLSVSAAPCGHCRQFLQELRNARDIDILITSDANPAYSPLIDLLPRPFGPSDLLDDGVPRLLESSSTNNNNKKKKEINVDGGISNGDGGTSSTGMEGVLIEAAMEAASGAYVPYSGCPSGFAVADREGRVYKGSYLESAAYNPSMGPVQAAMVGYVVGGGEEWEGIVGGALVEGDEGMVSHEGMVRVFFEKVAPAAEIWVRKFKIGEE